MLPWGLMHLEGDACARRGSLGESKGRNLIGGSRAAVDLRRGERGWGLSGFNIKPEYYATGQLPRLREGTHLD